MFRKHKTKVKVEPVKNNAAYSPKLFNEKKCDGQVITQTVNVTVNDQDDGVAECLSGCFSACFSIGKKAATA